LPGPAAAGSWQRLGDVCRRFVSELDRRNESIAESRERFDVPRTLGGIAENDAQAIRCRVETSFEVDEDIRGPEPFAQLIACHDLARPLQKGVQELEGLALQSDFDTVFAQLAGARIELEDAKPYNPASAGRTGAGHRREGVYCVPCLTPFQSV